MTSPAKCHTCGHEPRTPTTDPDTADLYTTNLETVLHGSSDIRIQGLLTAVQRLETSLGATTRDPAAISRDEQGVKTAAGFLATC